MTELDVFTTSVYYVFHLLIGPPPEQAGRISASFWTLTYCQAEVGNRIASRRWIYQDAPLQKSLWRRAISAETSNLEQRQTCHHVSAFAGLHKDRHASEGFALLWLQHFGTFSKDAHCS